MGGERFDTPQPESYLFGENADLNFLGIKPTLVRQKQNNNKGHLITYLVISSSSPTLRRRAMSPQRP